MTERYVITAGPSAGKTSTMNAIAAEGYHTVPEAARMYINQRVSYGAEASEVPLEEDFQENVVRMDRNIEENIPEDAGIVFMDRSLADNIAYYQHIRSEKPQHLIDECKTKYDGVFVLDMIGFEEDGVRYESGEDEAIELHETIRNAYMDCGYIPHDIPVRPIPKRVEMILGVAEHGR